MKLFESYYKNNYEELITYYPVFYREVYEMVEILKAQGCAFEATPLPALKTVVHPVEITGLYGNKDLMKKLWALFRIL